MIDRRRLLFTAAAGAGLAAAGQAVAFAGQEAAASGAQAELADWMQRVFNEMLLTSPETLTSLGMDKGPMAAMKARLDDRSIEKIEADKAQFLTFMTELNAIDRSALQPQSQVHYDAVKYFGDTAVSGYAFDYGGGFFPSPYTVHQMGGAYNGIPDFLDSQHAIDTAEDAEAYISRLEAFPTALDQETERMHLDFAAGAVPPDFIIDKTLQLLANVYETPAAESTLAASVARRTAEKNIAGDWGARAERIVT